MFKTAHDAVGFALMGNATLTLQSEQSGTHYTYQIKAPSETTDAGGKKRMFDSPIRFVSLLTAPDQYSYLGMVRDVAEPLLTTTRKSQMTNNSAPVRALNYLFDRASDCTSMPKGLIARHEGRCGRCGKQLTRPESIDTGFGPECADKVGVEWKSMIAA